MVIPSLTPVAVIVGILVALWFFHRKTRKENQIKLEQYYNEQASRPALVPSVVQADSMQLAYRQSIMSMSHAKNSLLALPADTV
jgi:predicted histidine transporter YuiF (NhaC family)